MARKPRIKYEGAFYHVISRGNQRQKYLLLFVLALLHLRPPYRVSNILMFIMNLACFLILWAIRKNEAKYQGIPDCVLVIYYLSFELSSLMIDRPPSRVLSEALTPKQNETTAMVRMLLTE
jgi:hypothetical protein